MNKAFILHGKPKKDRYLDPHQPKPHEANWLPWLADQLEQRGITAQVPAFPEPYAPIYEEWCRVFDALELDDQTVIIGHSAGAGFIVRWLSEHKDVSILQLILVAPWHDRDHEYGRAFFDYEIDPDLARRVGRITIMNSTDDGASIQASVALLRQSIAGINYEEFESFGHFMLGNKMMSVEFPEILAVLEAHR